MEHFYQNIEGFFTWPAFYSRLAEEMKSLGRPTFGVELGTFNGKSLAYFGVEIINNGAQCTVDCVDLHNADGIAIQNLASVRSVIRDFHAGKSWNFASKYEDQSLDFVFIDAKHTYEAVTKDIAAWRGKVRPGGIICGHDYSQDYAGLMCAVTEAFESWSVERGEKFPGASDLEPVGRQYFPVWSVRV